MKHASSFGFQGANLLQLGQKLRGQPYVLWAYWGFCGSNPLAFHNNSITVTGIRTLEPGENQNNIWLCVWCLLFHGVLVLMMACFCLVTAEVCRMGNRTASLTVNCLEGRLGLQSLRWEDQLGSRKDQFLHYTQQNVDGALDWSMAVRCLSSYLFFLAIFTRYLDNYLTGESRWWYYTIVKFWLTIRDWWWLPCLMYFY